MSETSPLAKRNYVKFTRKPAKMGQDYIISIPRLYIRNGVVDPNATYEIYMKKRPDK